MMPDIPPLELFDEIWRRHGHRCPMSTLGGRLGYAARRRLSGDVDSRDLHAVYRIATCALDGIRQATGCSEVGGSLEVRDVGQHRLTLVDRRSGRGVSAALRPAVLEMAAEYRRLDEELERHRPHLAAAEHEARLRRKEAVLDELLERLRTLPDAELMEFEAFACETEEV